MNLIGLKSGIGLDSCFAGKTKAKLGIALRHGFNVMDKARVTPLGGEKPRSILVGIRGLVNRGLFSLRVTAKYRVCKLPRSLNASASMVLI